MKQVLLIVLVLTGCTRKNADRCLGAFCEVTDDGAVGPRDLAGVDLAGVDLSAAAIADLAVADFAVGPSVDLFGVDLTGADLSVPPDLARPLDLATTDLAGADLAPTCATCSSPIGPTAGCGA